MKVRDRWYDPQTTNHEQSDLSLKFLPQYIKYIR